MLVITRAQLAEFVLALSNDQQGVCLRSGLFVIVKESIDKY